MISLISVDDELEEEERNWIEEFSIKVISKTQMRDDDTLNGENVRE